MKRAFYIIGGLTLAISIPSALQAQTTQPKDTTMNRTKWKNRQSARKMWNTPRHSFRRPPFQQV